NRFFSDNSLTRQQRLVECTKRRQARAREKAQVQEQRVGLLQQQYEHAMRMRSLREGRDVARMERKLQHVAASYIQYVWRKHQHVQAVAARRQRAAGVIARFVRKHTRHRQLRRHQASFRIQRRWRAHAAQQRIRKSLTILRSFLGLWYRRRTFARSVRALKIQRSFRSHRTARQVKAAETIQRGWRLLRTRKKLSHCYHIRRHQHRLKWMHHCARMLQRRMGIYTLYRRLIREPEFARFEVIMAQPLTTSTTGPGDISRLKDELKECTADSKRIRQAETDMSAQVSKLEEAVEEAKRKLKDEQERFARVHSVEAHRRQKEDASKRERMAELEAKTRKDIRMELEKEFEQSRREMLRERTSMAASSSSSSLPSGSRFDSASHKSQIVDTRVELTI
ncbi:TPA: hypothetical protein N0F65_009404, partial [Lagenidium giganteum]